MKTKKVTKKVVKKLDKAQERLDKISMYHEAMTDCEIERETEKICAAIMLAKEQLLAQQNIIRSHEDC